jgi:hypothetical protein
MWTLKVEHISGTKAFSVGCADTAKRRARELKQSVPGARFEIYDPQGSLYQYCLGATNQRLKWQWGR